MCLKMFKNFLSVEMFCNVIVLKKEKIFWHFPYTVYKLYLWRRAFSLGRRTITPSQANIKSKITIYLFYLIFAEPLAIILQYFIDVKYKDDDGKNNLFLFCNEYGNDNMCFIRFLESQLFVVCIKGKPLKTMYPRLPLISSPIRKEQHV